MNNLAVSLAQQDHPPSPAFSPAPSATHLHDARHWARRSLALAASIGPERRTAECDEGCAVAAINLGEFALWAGEWGEARRWCEEGRERSWGLGFREGVERAGELLGELEGKMKI